MTYKWLRTLKLNNIQAVTIPSYILLMGNDFIYITSSAHPSVVVHFSKHSTSTLRICFFFWNTLWYISMHLYTVQNGLLSTDITINLQLKHLYLYIIYIERHVEIMCNCVYVYDNIKKLVHCFRFFIFNKKIYRFSRFEYFLLYFYNSIMARFGWL